MNYVPDATETTVRMGTTDVEGLSIFYREAGKPGKPNDYVARNIQRFFDQKVACK